MDEVEQTAREAEATIARVDAMLKHGGELLQRGHAAIGDEAEVSALARAYIERQPSEHRAEYERELETLQQELERDLPKQTATRTARVKPTRQMV
jgi:hypothetical protein